MRPVKLFLLAVLVTGAACSISGASQINGGQLLICNGTTWVLVLPEWWRKNVLCFSYPLSLRSSARSPSLLQHP